MVKTNRGKRKKKKRNNKLGEHKGDKMTQMHRASEEGPLPA